MAEKKKVPPKKDKVEAKFPDSKFPPKKKEAPKKKAAPKKKEKWMQEAFGKNKGALHRQLGVPEDKPIPPAKLAAAAKSSDPKLKKRAIVARTAAKISKKIKKK
jgi:hypothetical protein